MKILKISLIIIILAFIGFNSINTTKGTLIKTPVIEEISLIVDGSITPVTKALTKTFHFITHILIEMDYDDPDWIGTEFGEGTALTNGTCFLYKGNPLFPENLTKNDQFYAFFVDIERFTDDKDPKNVHIYAHFDLDHIFGFEFPVNSLTDLQIIIQDDLTSATYDLTEFELFVQGYTLEESIEYTQKAPNFFEQIQGFAVGFMTEPLFWVILIIPLAFIIKLTRN